MNEKHIERLKGLLTVTEGFGLIVGASSSEDHKQAFREQADALKAAINLMQEDDQRSEVDRAVD